VINHDTGHSLPAGTIFKPNAEFMFRVMGIPPKNIALDTFITEARYEGALRRPLLPFRDNSLLTQPGDYRDMNFAQIGVDAARFGDDYGKIYLLQGMELTHEADLAQANHLQYFERIKAVCLKARSRAEPHRKHDDPPFRVSVRADGTGGFAGGFIDLLRADEDLRGWVTVHEVNFGASPKDQKSYRNTVTELYGQMAETLKGIRISRAPTHLKQDLTARKFVFVNVSGVTVKALEEKKDFKKRHGGRSPDDGDGAVLACAPEFLFEKPPVQIFL
jgi:hypothetical protein